MDADRRCHRVGSYCKSKVLGACIERRTAYCCFNTPLARILNEQIRPQLGRGWGAADDPICDGLAVAELAAVDWSRVNLDEWLAILTDTGHFPSINTLNLEVLTGTGSTYDVGGARPDAAERTGVRSEGLDTDAARRAAEMERWGTTLPVLREARRGYRKYRLFRVWRTAPRPTQPPVLRSAIPLTAMATSATPEHERRCSPWPFSSPRPSPRGRGGDGARCARLSR